MRIKEGEKNKATRHVIDYEKPLFILGPPEKNARDTQMNTRVTEDARRLTFALLHSPHEI